MCSNDLDNHRPITISAKHSQILDLLVIPAVEIIDTRYDVCKGNDAPFSCSLLPDVIDYDKIRNCPV